MAKYTDEQIKETLEKCLIKSVFGACKDCAFDGENPCIPTLVKNLFDLIDRQEAEIEELSSANLQLYMALENAKSEAVKEYIELLKAEFLKDYKGNDEFAYFIFGYLDKVADFMVANGVTVGDNNVGCKADANNATTTWISVEDRLPDTDDSLLVICNGEYKNIRFINACELAIYDTVEDEWILESYPKAAVTVTHWMPLPKPPKGVE